jgi:hypothetical protein
MMTLEVEDTELHENELIELLHRGLDLEYIPKHTICIQNNYMRQSRALYMSLKTSVQQFVERLNDLNGYLLYFS